jgi:hypothetical protein
MLSFTRIGENDLQAGHICLQNKKILADEIKIKF